MTLALQKNGHNGSLADPGGQITALTSKPPGPHKYDMDLNAARLILKKSDPKRSILRQLGVLGWEKYEMAILMALLLAETPALVGPHGEGKTWLVHQLARALNQPFVSYDTAKAMFEDIMGIPNPKVLMAEGTYEFIETARTIWGKRMVLLDEFSRADAHMVAKYMELLDWRRSMGGEATGVQWLFVAYNPPFGLKLPNQKLLRYVGCQPIEAATLDRLMFYLDAPLIAQLPKEARNAFYMSKRDRVPKGIEVWKNKQFTLENPLMPPSVCPPPLQHLMEMPVSPEFRKAAIELQALLYVAADVYAEIMDRWHESIFDYVDSMVTQFLSVDIVISGRKQEHWIMAIAALLTLHMVRNNLDIDALGNENIRKLVGEMMPLLLPMSHGEGMPDLQQMTTTHDIASKALTDRNNPLFAITNETHLVKKIGLLLKIKNRSESNVALVVKGVSEKMLDSTTPLETQTQGACALAALVLLHAEGLELPTANNWAGVVDELQTYLVSGASNGKFMETNNFDGELFDLMEAIAPENPVDGYCINIALRQMQQTGNRVVASQITARAQSIRNTLNEALLLYRDILSKSAPATP